MTTENDVKVVHVEVQDKSTGEWNSVNVGDIQLAVAESNNNNRKQLPQTVKALLLAAAAPAATDTPRDDALSSTTKNRKDYYLFRHAPNGQPNMNLIIFLHGAGDTHRPFDKLGQTMALPQTATLSVAAKGGYEELPFGLGYTWFQEMDYITGMPLPDDHPDRIQSLMTAAVRFCNLLEELIQNEQWISAERVFLFGFGCGATLVSQVCISWAQRHLPPLGGAICVCGGSVLVDKKNKKMSSIKNGMTSNDNDNNKNNNKTPILLMVGEKDVTFPPHKALSIQKLYGSNVTKVHVERGKGQEMVNRPSEMEQIMIFLSQRLVRQSQIPTTD